MKVSHFHRALAGLLVAAAIVSSQAATAAGTLWYNGNFDGRDSQANEINNTLIPDARVYDNFLIPSGTRWVITDVFSNDLITTQARVTQAHWEIRSGVVAGNGGTLLASGDSPATQTPTGRSQGGIPEDTITVPGLGIDLGPGAYFLVVAPHIPASDPFGQSYISTTSGAGAIGMPPGNDGNSYFTSTSLGNTFTPSASVSVLGPGTWDFSMGVDGTSIVTTVPEPSSLTICLSAALVLALHAQYRGRASLDLIGSPTASRAEFRWIFAARDGIVAGPWSLQPMPRNDHRRHSGRRRPTPGLERLEDRQLLSALAKSTDLTGPTREAIHLNSLRQARVHHGHAHPGSAAGLARSSVGTRGGVRGKPGDSTPDVLRRDVVNIPAPDAIGFPQANAYTPSQIRKAYGFDQLTGQGQGVTIAIVDAFDDPNIASDLSAFSAQFGLPQMDGQGGDPTFTKAFPQGMPTANPGSAEEISLDVEWVHSLAPMANIMLVEIASLTRGNTYGNANSGVSYAKAQTGVVVISNSYGAAEFAGETAFDSNFLPLDGHPVAITYGSGDNGAAGRYPASSPNVVAVGGTSLATLSASGRYGYESGWSNSGGGPSLYESRPAFQSGLPFGDTRTIPDVGFDANPSTGVAVYNTYSRSGWTRVGGNSFASPAWSALIALADQARIANGLPALTSNEVNAKLYADYQSSNYLNDFHDITTGNNGYPAGPGYDLITGIGTPKVPNVVQTLAAAP